MISAKVVADSTNEFGDRLTSLEVVLPRYILAEGKTHRIIKGALGQVDIEIEESIGLNDFQYGSKNSASSRAIKFEKMVKSVMENPFVPYAWQKEHTGMQGFEYYKLAQDEHDKEGTEDLVAQWLEARDSAVYHAQQLFNKKVTKQLINRLLEPFMWHKVLISATEWENFFQLRCPRYSTELTGITDRPDREFFSWKELCRYADRSQFYGKNILDKLKANKGQADIHMMFLAEAIWDAINESKPKLLRAGEWHIVYEDKVDKNKISNSILEQEEGINRVENKLTSTLIKITTGMAARASYTVVGDEKEVKYETLIGIHDKMLVQNPFHASPFEHNSKCMGRDDADNYLRIENGNVEERWCRNYRGFIQHRSLIENNIKI